MKKPFAAYRGPEPFVFVCYAHADADPVYSDLQELHKRGVKLWYDEGIPAGTSWRAEIASAIAGARKFLFFISEESLRSAHCLREVDYALNHNIEIVPVYLDDSELPAELELALNRVQALFRSKDGMYLQHLLGAMQKSRPFSPLPSRSSGPVRRYLGPIIAVFLVMLSLAVWVQWDREPDDGQSAALSAALPNAIDRYLAGLELVKRWDKDDNLDRAIALFQEAAELDPEFALAYARLADALRMRAALTRDKSWLDQASTSADTAVQLNPNLAPVQMAVGRIHAARGNYDLAFATLQRALTIDPNDASINHAMASVYERLGRLDDAEAALEKAVSLEPENLIVVDAYANFLYRQSRYEEAIVQWQNVVRMAPDHYAALVNLGSALNESGRIPEAITMFERAITIRPTYMAYANLGTVFGRAGRYQDAETAYLRALEFEEADWLGWGNLAYIYSWMHGRDQDAMKHFQRAIELAEDARQSMPRDAFVHSDLALYYAKTGQQELAVQRLGAALSLAPNSGEIQAAGAEVYELIGQRDEAVVLALRSLALGYPRQQIQRNPELIELVADPRMQ